MVGQLQVQASRGLGVLQDSDPNIVEREREWINIYLTLT